MIESLSGRLLPVTKGCNRPKAAVITMVASMAKAAFRVAYEIVDPNFQTWQRVTLPLTYSGRALTIRTSKNYWTVWLFRPS